MKILRPLFIIVLSGLTLLLAGCLEYEEDLYLNADGSGRVAFRFSMVNMDSVLNQMGQSLNQDTPAVPGDAMSRGEEEIRMMTEGIEGLEYVKGRSYSDGGRQYFEGEITFENLLALGQLSDSGAGEQPDFFGQIEWVERDGEYHFTRRVDTGGGADSGEADAFGGLVASAMFSQYKFRYTTHFPGEVQEANSPAINEDDKSVTWTVPFGVMMSQPVLMEATVEKRSSALFFGLAGLAVLLVITAIVIILMVLPRKK